MRILYYVGGVVVVLLFIWVLYEPGPNAEGSAREARLAELRQELNLTEDQALTWSPMLQSQIFDVGAVFVEDERGQALTAKCDEVAFVEAPYNLRLGSGKRHGVTAEGSAPVGADASLELAGAKALEFELTITGARVAPGMADMMEELLGDADCLATIVNRPVYVLYGIYRGDERYALNRSLTANLDLARMPELVKARFGADLSVNNSRQFSRTDSNLIWALTRVTLRDTANFQEESGEEERRSRAQELLEQESGGYVARLLANAEPPRAPTEQELEAITSEVMATAGEAKPEGI